MQPSMSTFNPTAVGLRKGSLLIADTENGVTGDARRIAYRKHSTVQLSASSLSFGSPIDW